MSAPLATAAPDNAQQKAALRQNKAARAVREKFPVGAKVQARGAKEPKPVGIVERHIPGMNAQGGTLKVKWPNGNIGSHGAITLEHVQQAPAKRADVLRALPINRHFTPDQVVAKMKVNGVTADVGEVGKVLEELAKTDKVEKLGDNKYRRIRQRPEIKPRGKVEVVGVKTFKPASEFKK
jgi:hypothetical protein